MEHLAGLRDLGIMRSLGRKINRDDDILFLREPCFTSVLFYNTRKSWLSSAAGLVKIGSERWLCSVLGLPVSSMFFLQVFFAYLEHPRKSRHRFLDYAALVNRNGDFGLGRGQAKVCFGCFGTTAGRGRARGSGSQGGASPGPGLDCQAGTLP